jgi:iron complex transport system ATP-binding protein
MLEIKNLSIKYGNNLVLDDISLKFERGNLYGLLGINGSGKTSVLNAVLKFVPFDGEITIDDSSIKKLGRMQLARKVSYMRQHFNVNFSYTVEEIVKMSRYSDGLHDIENSDYLEEIINVAKLGDLWNKNILEISGGERQRAFFAKTLAQDSDIILIDEGFANIDIYYQLRFINYLRQLTEKRNKTVVLVIHDINFTLKAIDKVVVFNGAKIYGCGETSEVITNKMMKDVFKVDVDVSGNGINYLI